MVTENTLFFDDGRYIDSIHQILLLIQLSDGVIRKMERSKVGNRYARLVGPRLASRSESHARRFPSVRNDYFHFH